MTVALSLGGDFLKPPKLNEKLNEKLIEKLMDPEIYGATTRGNGGSGAGNYSIQEEVLSPTTGGGGSGGGSVGNRIILNPPTKNDQKKTLFKDDRGIK